MRSLRDVVQGLRVLRTSVLTLGTPEHDLETLQVLRLRLHRLEPSRPLRDARAAAAFIRERGIVLETGSSGLPVLAEAIAGRQIRGSWMADRDVYRIHRLVNRVRRYGVVAAPLILGKETVFMPALGPAVERVAVDGARCADARRALPPLARKLLADVDRTGEIRMDRWSGPAADARRARLLLVRHCLVWSSSFHTESGYHTAMVTPWRASAFSSRFNKRASRLNYREAARRLMLAALRAAVVAPEREVRRWFIFGADPLDALLDKGLVRRLRSGRTLWLTAVA